MNDAGCRLNPKVTGSWPSPHNPPDFQAIGLAMVEISGKMSTREINELVDLRFVYPRDFC